MDAGRTGQRDITNKCSVGCFEYEFLYRRVRDNMIRFCDGEVDCVEYSSLTRMELLDYFLPDHKDDILCVYNDFTRMKYIGIITYSSFKQSINIDGAIRKEYVIFDENIWKNAKKYLAQQTDDFAVDSLLPVLNEVFQLVGFAYDDTDANREVRMLRELKEKQDAVQFLELYPEIKCVRIYEFNELAYYFAIYLGDIGIAVETVGTLWEGWRPKETISYPDYECMMIYAEGVGEKKHNWKDRLLKSVSVEFECIDNIYEYNIKNNNIRDAEGDFSWFIEKLQSEKELIIIGTGVESLNAYDLLKANGVDILCFLSENKEKWNYRLFGKRILSGREIKRTAKKPVFLDCYTENSAWGGAVDRYDYEGYRRNQQYFVVRDYVDIPIGNLSNILRGKDVVLLGNLNLCCNVNRVLKDVGDCRVTYWDLTGENSTKKVEITLADGENINQDAIYFLIKPQYYLGLERERQIQQENNLYLQKLKEYGIDNFSEYFSNDEVLISIQRYDSGKFTMPWLTPKKILINVSGHMSGNVFFKNLLDGHPQILQIDDSGFASNLYPICMQLAEEKAENILEKFWEIYSKIYEEKVTINRKKLFDKKFNELLSYKEFFTSQELFVILHISYAYIWNFDIASVEELLIYYAPLLEISGELRTKYESWLDDEKVKGYSIYLARNAYVRAGSYFKFFEYHGGFFYPNIRSFWRYMGSNNYNESSDLWDRINVRFEDLKISPKETLTYICNELGILWSDNLGDTTFYGERAEYPSGKEIISGFDLKPVYNLYEEYFSEFDRFRINMLFSGVQKKFNYSYVNCISFSRRQLQEMFLEEFRFEYRLPYENEYWKIRYRKNLISKVRECLQRVRREEILKQNENECL